MAKVVEFANPCRPGGVLDFQHLPKLVIKNTLHFEHNGERYEDTLRPHIHAKTHQEIRAIEGGSMFRETCLDGFVNTVYWQGFQFPSAMTCVVLLNAPNTTRHVKGKILEGRHSDIWWFNHDRHSLYSVLPAVPTQQSHWPPRDDEVYRNTRVGVARQVFPLMPAGVEELLPSGLLKELLFLRASNTMSEREHRILRYIRVPEKPPQRKMREVFVHDADENSWDVESDDSDVSETAYEDAWDVSEIGDEAFGLWRWVYCLGLSTPMLLRERYREESPSYIDFTEPIFGLVRLRDMGIDPKKQPSEILRECLDVLLDCCPPRWQDEAKRGVLICPVSKKLLVTAKTCHYILRAIPLSLRMALGMTNSSGIDFPCKWGVNMASGPGRQVVWRISADEVEVAAERKHQVKNTQHSRSVRDALNVGHVRDLTWADLKMFEVLGTPRETCSTEKENAQNFQHASDDKGALGAASEGLSFEIQKEASNVREAALEAVRVANESARREKERRKQAIVRPQKQESSKRRGTKCEQKNLRKTPAASTSMSAADSQPEATDASLRRIRASAIEAARRRATDEDLDELLRTPEKERSASDAFRSVGRNMKKALFKEKCLQNQRRLAELFGS